jgi:HTH-type transcriptional regulator / antitoxin HigA
LLFYVIIFVSLRRDANMELYPIRTEADYQAALKEIESLFDALPDTPEYDRLDLLSTLVETYEKVHHPIEAPDPIEAILYYMDTRGLTRRDLEPCLGSRARVSEILSRKRSLTLEMIRKLNKELGIPAEILIQSYDAIRTPA